MKTHMIFMMILPLCLSLTSYVYASYKTSSSSSDTCEVAKYVIDVEDTFINIDNMYPSVTRMFDLYISNYDDRSLSEVDVEYEIILEKTNILPLSYTLLFNGLECIKQYEDEHKIIYSASYMNASVNTKDSYVLKISWDEKDNDVKYANKKEEIVLRVHVKQLEKVSYEKD